MDDRLYVVHVLECIERAESYALAGRDAFIAEPMRQDAVVRVLQVLAESTQRVSPELKARHPEVDWRGLSGFRNVLVHDYLGVDLAAVWALVESAVPALRAAMQCILSELE